MGMNILGSAVRTSDFSSNDSLIDIPDCTVVFTLASAATVLIMGKCVAVYLGDEVPSSKNSQFSYSVDASDKDGVLINYEINGSETGWGRIPATFWALEALAAGSHTIKLRGKTQNGTVTGAILQPISLVVMG